MPEAMSDPSAYVRKMRQLRAQYRAELQPPDGGAQAKVNGTQLHLMVMASAAAGYCADTEVGQRFAADRLAAVADLPWLRDLIKANLPGTGANWNTAGRVSGIIASLYYGVSALRGSSPYADELYAMVDAMTPDKPTAEGTQRDRKSVV